MALMLSICFCMMPCQVFAASTADAVEFIETDRDCTLSITYVCDETALACMDIKLYKVADISADFVYTLTHGFESYDLSLNGVQAAAEWDVIRSTIEAYILADSIEADAVVTTDEDGKADFSQLKPGLYFVPELTVTRDDAKYRFDSALIALPGIYEDGHWQYEQEVVAKSEMIPPVDSDDETELKVLKLWSGDEGKTTRPKSIRVEIFRDGVSDHSVTLSDDNNWSYSWTVPEDGAKWTVIERNIPTGYTMTVEERKTTFVLTNTFVPDNPDSPDNPRPPQTGDTSNVLVYIILLNAAGIMLITLGFTGKRKKDEKSE